MNKSTVSAIASDQDKEEGQNATTEQAARDHSMFDAELSGAVLNMSLLGRILGWMTPYKYMFALSALLVLVWSTLSVMLPVIISVVVVDHIIRQEAESVAPDFGLIELTDWIALSLDVSPLVAACVLYAIVQLLWGIVGHAHRQTLIASVINGLKDLRLDLFRHLETRPSSFYDRVAVGRIMTRVTNDVEALYELLRALSLSQLIV